MQSLCIGIARHKPTALRHLQRIGRPPGDDSFVAEFEPRLGRVLEAGTPGPRPGLSQWPVNSVIGVTVNHLAL